MYVCAGLKRKPLALIKRLRKAKKEAPPLEKPAVVKTHLRNMIVVPEMIGSVVGIYNGKVFNQIEVKVSCIALSITTLRPYSISTLAIQNFGGKNTEGHELAICLYLMGWPLYSFLFWKVTQNCVLWKPAMSDKTNLFMITFTPLL